MGVFKLDLIQNLLTKLSLVLLKVNIVSFCESLRFKYFLQLTFFFISVKVCYLANIFFSFVKVNTLSSL